MKFDCLRGMNEKKNRLDSIHPKQPNYPDADFFEQMAASVISTQANPFTKTPFYKKPIVKWVAAAAIVVPFVFYFSRTTSSNPEMAVQLDTIPQETIIQYIENQSETPVVLAFKNGNEPQSSVKSTFDKVTVGIADEEIIQYLNEEYGSWEEESDLFD